MAVPQSKLIVELTEQAGVELWRDPAGNAHATLHRHGHVEHHRLRSMAFRSWLAWLAHRELGITPGSQVLQNALIALEGAALFDGAEYDVHVRLAYWRGNVYLDLADAEWRCVEVTPKGYTLLDMVPAQVRFRRARGMKALPVPEPGGSLDQLRGLLNVRDEDWVLALAWLVQATRPRGPYPVLELTGEQGTAKSTAARLLRDIIDPNEASLRSSPKEPRDLAIAATNSWVVSLDNLSHIPNWLSDDLCRLSTGGGFATRQLYSDSDELIFMAQRPVILNGIAAVAERNDLIDRVIPIQLQQISDGQRLTERQLFRRFEDAHPRILGALLDAIATGLRRSYSIDLPSKSRMADFETWVVATEPSLGVPEGDFRRAYGRARKEAIEVSIDTSTVGQWIRELAHKGGFTGTATELFGLAEDRLRRASDFPKNARALTAEIRRLLPALRAVGISVTFDREPDRSRRRVLVIEGVADFASFASEASAEEDFESETGPDLRTQNPDADANDGSADANSESSQIQTDAKDASDAKIPTFSDSGVCNLCGRGDPCEDCLDAGWGVRLCADCGQLIDQGERCLSCQKAADPSENGDGYVLGFCKVGGKSCKGGERRVRLYLGVPVCDDCWRARRRLVVQKGATRP